MVLYLHLWKICVEMLLVEQFGTLTPINWSKCFEDPIIRLVSRMALCWLHRERSKKLLIYLPITENFPQSQLLLQTSKC